MHVSIHGTYREFLAKTGLRHRPATPRGARAAKKGQDKKRESVLSIPDTLVRAPAWQLGARALGWPRRRFVLVIAEKRPQQAESVRLGAPGTARASAGVLQRTDLARAQIAKTAGPCGLQLLQ